MTRTLTVLLLVISQGMQNGLSGQQNRATITFAEKEFNFGTFRESDGTVSHTFLFMNDGDLPLIINNVISSCDCTVSDWPREPVIPGQAGMIRVHYDPEGRPGSFTRAVVVNSNAETPVVNLVVRGVVIPVARIEEVYQYKIGDLRLETIYAAFGEIYKGNTGKQMIGVYNASDDAVLHINFPDLPAHIRAAVDPEILEPLQEGIIELEYLTGELDDWDFVVDRLAVNLNGKTIQGYSLNVTANIREDFSGLTGEELSQSPLASFDDAVFNFGVIGEEQPVSHDFILTNLGKNDLYIRKISASCGCTAVQPETKMVKPGASARITAVFDPKGQGGNQKKAITVITNDPKHSKTILWIEGMVEVASGNVNDVMIPYPPDL
ncbi:MAG: DUF1573 domain-containing protein [Bacteroidales bacterium]|nr:DUF1573 domain-containing protein [Bacteroidales bacterium]